MDARVTSLPALEAAVWAELARAVADHRHPWRTPVLATIADDRADARTVVLREVDVDQRQLLIYTDERAAKVPQLLKHPNGTLVMWSPQLGWQLRCQVRLALEMSGLAASSRWARVKLSPSARDYLSPLPPGTPLATPAGATPAGEPAPRAYFSVISAEVASIDWLDLHPDGHHRALLCGDASRWLQP
ncbi:MAG: pyridoxamine 5'-phosphate oxidase family protein [Burkholderiales bacterium]|nr:pyridoxamine 5'-phosphate oxidase family protein [Burkholderiales bacterium]